MPMHPQVQRSSASGWICSFETPNMRNFMLAEKVLDLTSVD
jgi:hypothetical protein